MLVSTGSSVEDVLSCQLLSYHPFLAPSDFTQTMPSSAGSSIRSSCGHQQGQVVLVGLSRSPTARQREFAGELVKQLQELGGSLAASSDGALRTALGPTRGVPARLRETSAACVLWSRS